MDPRKTQDTVRGIEARGNNTLATFEDQRRGEVAQQVWGGADWDKGGRGARSGTRFLVHQVGIRVETAKHGWIFGPRAETPSPETLGVDYMGGIQNQKIK